MFTVELFNRQFGAHPIPPQLVARPLRWAVEERGGPQAAEIELTGPLDSLWQALHWMRFGVQIRNPMGVLVWWGYIHEAIVDMGGTAIGLSLESMYNSIKVLYSYIDADGASQEGTTAAQTSTDSINTYGTRELRHSAGELNPTAAEKLRDTLHGWQKFPVPISEQGSGQRAVLRCRGWYETLAWKYYADDTGKIVQDAGSAEQIMGWTITSPLIGFTNNKRIHLQDRAFAALRQGDKFVVSGSASNNGTFKALEVPGDQPEDEPKTYTATTIAMEVSDDIKDSAGGLGFVNVDDLLEVDGTASNDGHYWVDYVTAKHLATVGASITNEAAGASVTLKRSLNVRVEEAVAYEVPGASVTITLHGQKIAQKWWPPAGTWTADEVSLYLYKKNGPTDNVQVELCSDSAGLPGGVLATTTLAAASIGVEPNWHSFIFATPATVTLGTAYWIVVSRTGAATNENYYRLMIDEEKSYGAGVDVLKLYTGSAWADRVEDGNLAFQIWGLRDNAAQIEDVVDSCGQFITDFDGQTTSGISTRHFRDGMMVGLDEINALLDQGKSTGARLLARVTNERIFQLYAEPASGINTDLMLGQNGKLFQPDGQPIPEGWCPAGQWARVQNLPIMNALAPLSPMFLRRVEYDGEAGMYYVEPRGAPTFDNMPITLKQG